jgi:ATP-dependent DNA helicase Rep
VIPAAGLNPAQTRAVMHTGGPCLVLAGAGSGKTRVVVHKLARLLGQGVAPARLAAITFTNKAAAEMRDRARELCGARAARELVVSTFHSLGVRMLRAHGERIGLKPNFSILDSDDVLALVRECGGHGDNAAARRVQWQISLWKNQGLDAAEALRTAADADAAAAARTMQRVQERLAAYQAVDFDDLIGLPLALFRRDEEARAAWRCAFDHVLVDEVQDTNAVQYELLKALVGTDADSARGRCTAFTAVGDDDQGIYGWRGATIENLARLQAEYPRLEVIALEQNYRSTGHILRAANAVIANNPKLFDKRLWSDLGDGEPVAVLACDGEEHEADRAVARIQALRGREGANARFADFAVLYRTNHQAKVFEQKLRAAKLPYKVSGGQSFFDRAEIKDLCAWLRLVVNGDDDPAFLRAAQTPRRGIGAATLTTLAEFAAKLKTSLFEALASPMLGAVLKGKAIDALREFGREVNELEFRARHTSGSEAVRALLMEWLVSIGYEQHLHDSEDRETLASARWSNVLDFVGWVSKRCGGEVEAVGGSFESEPKSLFEAAQTIALIASIAEREGDTDVITLSTLHAAKGLEWPHVFLAGVNEGVLPYRAEGEELTPDRLHEERRLMYVGITRARRTLAVSHLKRRRRGREGSVAGTASRFVAEMKLAEAAGAAEDPRAKLKRLRDEMAARADASPATARP